MKNETLMMILLLVAVVALAFRHFGRENGRLAAAQEAADTKMINMESRLEPLEQDLQRRKAIRGKVSATLGWIRGKLGF